MTANATTHSQDRLALRSRLPEVARVPEWLAAIASRHSIPENTQFAMNLCLEEALSNIIRHGYGTAEDDLITVNFTIPRENYFVFTVEDQAPSFNPLYAPELPALSPQDEIRIGGQGVRLLRRFADTLEYEAIPAGNRLRIGFLATGSKPEAR